MVCDDVVFVFGDVCLVCVDFDFIVFVWYLFVECVMVECVEVFELCDVE